MIGPFRIEEAERLLVTIRQDWGEAQANYDEFRFFTGLRPSEQIVRIADVVPELVQHERVGFAVLRVDVRFGATEWRLTCSSISA